MNEIELIESTISEYRDLLELSGEGKDRLLDKNDIISDLACKHDWTLQGAQTIVSLACEYGAFILRNAVALAIVLEREDGDLGF
jgi:hypothetical protein